MKTVENFIKKCKLRIAVLLLMMFMIIGHGQAWGAEPAWSQMGVSGINGINNANASSMVILNGTPYLAYTAYTGAGVVKYDGTNWVTVGTNSTGTQYNNVAMVELGSTLYVAYSNKDFSRIEVKKCDTASGSTWTDLGIATGSALSIDSPLSLAVNSDSDIYVGNADYSTNLFKVFHYDGSTWAYQFNTNGSEGWVTSVNSVAYAAYRDGSNNRLCQNSGSGWNQIQALSGIPRAICNDGIGKIYILTEDRSSSPISLAVVCYDITQNTCTIVGSHIPVSSAYSPSISVDNGTVYVMYYISGGTSFLYAHESTADWVQVGPPLSMAYYGDMTAYNGSAYYAYSNQYKLTATKITYPAPVPKVTGVSPANGPEAGGTSVTITGENFIGATGVSFGATPAASFTVNSSTQVTATAPAGSGTVDVTVTGPEGTSTTSSNDQFTYYRKPAVTSVSPINGPAAGGNSVTITGTNFTGATGVSFGAAPATSFTVSSPTSITAIAPAGSETVHVTVTGPGGTSDTSSNDQFAYIQGPVVTGISPVNGPASGGTSVTITGTNFTGTTSVSFGAAAATSFTVSSPTSITATAPAGSGTVDVRVTGPGGTSATSSNDQFTYIQRPVVTGISPVSGPAAGATSISITGTNFTGATAVSFGATPATSFTVNSPTSITATAPAGSGTVDVTVTVAGPAGTSATSSNDRFTYYQQPTVTGISPTSGALAGGTSVTITGTNFTGATSVSFGAVSATSFTVSSPTSITAIAPVGIIGAVDVRVTGPGGTSATSAGDLYTYQTHYIIVIGTLSGGSITASPITEVAGATITLVVTPENGKQLKAGTLKYNDGSDHSITGTSFTMPAINVTVTAEFETIPDPAPVPGNGGRGGRGGSTMPEKPKTTLSASGNISIATTTAKATVDSSGKASTEVTREQISDAVGKAVAAAEKQDNGTSVVEVKVEAAKEAKSVETKLPKAAFDAMFSSSIAQLNVSTPVADITFDSNVLSTISGGGSGDIKITASKVESSALSTETQQVIGDRPVFNFSVSSGNTIISQFGGNVSVSVPYSPKPGEDTNAIVIYYINAEGKPEIVRNCVYDPASGSITFNTNHFSQFAVGYNQMIFKDVSGDAWYSKAVSFIAAREITTGTGSDKFSPKAKLTRGQFIVMLMKAYGIAPDMNPKDNFADAGSTYYTGYLAAAKRMDITAGVGNNMSMPEKEITRQEMVTLLYNALKAIDKLPQGSSGESLTSFNDAGNIASWAKDAMKLFTETGIISGSGNKLSPKDTTTRVQMAQVLYSLLSE